MDTLDIRKLIQDPIYRQFLQTAPVLSHTLPDHHPWYFYLKKEWVLYSSDGTKVVGSKVGWRRKPCQTYQQAYGLLRANYKDAIDCCVTCRVIAVDPPLDERRGKAWNWHRSPELARYDLSTQYIWCGYCRRPTRFKFFTRHHAVKEAINDDKRCEICGIRERMLR